MALNEAACKCGFLNITTQRGRSPYSRSGSAFPGAIPKYRARWRLGGRRLMPGMWARLTTADVQIVRPNVSPHVMFAASLGRDYLKRSAAGCIPIRRSGRRRERAVARKSPTRRPVVTAAGATVRHKQTACARCSSGSLGARCDDRRRQRALPEAARARTVVK